MTPITSLFGKEIVRPLTSSIRRQLLCWLFIPVIALFAIDLAIANYVALETTIDAYDDSLIDSAEAVASRLTFGPHETTIDLPNSFLSFLKINGKDLFYYQVLDSRGKLLWGNEEIPAPLHVDEKEPDVRTSRVAGNRARIAAMVVQSPTKNEHVIVQVAETLQARNDLIGNIILSIILPQFLFIALLAGAIWLGIKKGLRPLKNLQDAVEKRSPTDLRPLDEVSAPKEVKPLVYSINQLLERLREDREAQQRFVANAAHQLRTPLAGLKTQTQLALRQDQANELHHSLQQIGTSAERATRLVRQLLTLARVEPPATSGIRLSPVDLQAIARAATQEVVPLALEKSIDLGFECKERSATISGDSESLHEMLINLIENAVLYTPTHGKVTVRIEEGPSLIVEDNGPGIPPQERERVFERFYRVLGTGVSGSGLGLAIVREIADYHKATIALGTGVGGRGTSVNVSFETTTISPQAIVSSVR